jgi:hypothetical protein
MPPPSFNKQRFFSDVKEKILSDDRTVIGDMKIELENQKLEQQDLLSIIDYALEKNKIPIAYNIFDLKYLEPDTYLLKDCVLGQQPCNLLTLVRHYPGFVDGIVQADENFALELNDRGRNSLFYTITDGSMDAVLKNLSIIKRKNKRYLFHQDHKGNTILFFWALRKSSMNELFDIMHHILSSLSPEEQIELIETLNEHQNSALDIANEVGNRDAIIVLSFFLNKARRENGEISAGWQKKIGGLESTQRAQLRSAWERKYVQHDGGGVEESKEKEFINPRQIRKRFPEFY